MTILVSANHILYIYRKLMVYTRLEWYNISHLKASQWFWCSTAPRVLKTPNITDVRIAAYRYLWTPMYYCFSSLDPIGPRTLLERGYESHIIALLISLHARHMIVQQQLDTSMFQLNDSQTLRSSTLLLKANQWFPPHEDTNEIPLLLLH